MDYESVLYGSGNKKKSVLKHKKSSALNYKLIHKQHRDEGRKWNMMRGGIWR